MEKAFHVSKRFHAAETGRTPFDGLRPWSAVTHGVGALLALAGTVMLLLRGIKLGSSAWHLVSFGIYGASMIGLYTASTLYHCVNAGEAGRIALRKYDHTSIYLLIAGTFTPLCLVPLRGPWGFAILGVIWALAIVGITQSILWIMAPRWVTVALALFMGWIAVVPVYPLSRALPPQGLFWLVFGGVLYTVGGILYAVKWPGRNNPLFGCHEIFHVFILLGSIAHFILIYRIIAFLP